MAATPEKPLEGKIAVITGTSRGIGAEIAKALAVEGCNIIGNHVNPAYDARQSAVEAAVTASGVWMESVLADITEPEGRDLLLDAMFKHHTGIDYLILNAAGGLEADKGPGWAEKINIEAQLALVDNSIDYIRSGGKILYLTSLWAHHYGDSVQPPGYEPVARTKHAAEEALRVRIPEFQARDLSFGVLCGHVVTGTAAYSVFRLGARDYLRDLEQTAEGGKFPTAEEMGQATKDMILTPFKQGYIKFVGGQEVAWIPEELKGPYILDKEDVRNKLPMYSDSKLLVDRFDSPMDKQEGVGYYTVRDQDTEGHFGGDYADIQLFRGVDQVEAAAQTLGLVFLGSEPGTQAVPLFRGINKAEFLKMIFPGDELTMKARITERTSNGVKGNCDIFVGDIEVAAISGIDLGLAPSIEFAKRLASMQRSARSPK